MAEATVTPTKEQLEDLSDRALATGDLLRYSLVQQAREGHKRALVKCAEIIKNEQREAGWEW